MESLNQLRDEIHANAKEKVSLEMYHKRSQIKKMAENFSYNRVMAEAIAYKKRNM